MTRPRLLLFDDRNARGWAPFSLTRPAGELRYGASLLRERAERVLGLPCAGHLCAEHLAGLHEHGAAPVIGQDQVRTDRPVVLLSSRAVPDSAPAGGWGNDPATIVIDGEPCGMLLPAGRELPDDAALSEGAFPAAERAIELKGEVLGEVWQLVARSADRIARDIDTLGSGGRLPRGVEALGSGALRVGERVTIEPGVLLDARSGPIWLDDDVTVRAFTRLEGPAYVGPGTTLMGGLYAAVSIGPRCKVHGEVEESVVLGYSNKAHDGFLGHAYVGRWVNLGALTTNSDLKNNYGSIRIWTPDGERDTGLIKLGCLLGDHVKTGIGMLLNTGTVVGAGSNLYGAEMPPKHVPPFSWGSGSELVEFELPKFMAVAETVMARRDVRLEAGERAVLERAWRLGRAEASGAS